MKGELMKSLLEAVTHLALAIGRLGVLVVGFVHSFVGLRYYWEGNALSSINNLALALVFFVLYLLNWTVGKNAQHE